MKLYNFISLNLTQFFYFLIWRSFDIFLSFHNLKLTLLPFITKSTNDFSVFLDFLEKKKESNFRLFLHFPEYNQKYFMLKAFSTS